MPWEIDVLVDGSILDSRAITGVTPGSFCSLTRVVIPKPDVVGRDGERNMAGVSAGNSIWLLAGLEVIAVDWVIDSCGLKFRITSLPLALMPSCEHG
jgi:hypothetical protein